MALVESLEHTTHTPNVSMHKKVTLVWRVVKSAEKTYVYLANSASGDPSAHRRQVLLLDESTGPALLQVLRQAYPEA